jgi:PAS domain S-box-containing protein
VQRSSNGAVHNIAVMIKDISEQKKAESELLQKEKYFNKLFENSSDITTILDESGRIIYVSKSLENIMGYTLDTIKSQNIFEFIHPDDIHKAKDFFNSSLSGNMADRIHTLRVKNSAGEYRYHEGLFTNMLDDPAVQGIVINSRDVSDRVLAEVNLQTVEMFSAATLNSLSTHICVIDENGDIININKAWKEFSHNNFPGNEFAEGKNFFRLSKHRLKILNLLPVLTTVSKLYLIQKNHTQIHTTVTQLTARNGFTSKL